MHLQRGNSRQLDDQNAQRTGGFVGPQGNVQNNSYSDNTVVPQFGGIGANDQTQAMETSFAAGLPQEYSQQQLPIDQPVERRGSQGSDVYYDEH